MGITRREFVKWSGVGLGALALPGLPRGALAGTASDRTLVAVFLRGGADGLNLVVPRGDDANYRALRTGLADLAVPKGPAQLELDGFFELHPALAPLAPCWQSGELAVVHAVGGSGDYSHFGAQDAMDAGAPRSFALAGDGWLHRALAALRARGELDAPVLALSGVTIGPKAAKSLEGDEASLRLSFPSIAGFRLEGPYLLRFSELLGDLYRGAADPLLSGAGGAVFDAMKALSGLGDEPPVASYPMQSAALSLALQDAARLVKHPELGVRAIAIDTGGWDHHLDEAIHLDGVAAGLAGSLAAFLDDLGEARHRTLVLVMTEFGRAARVNGSRGTDHGWGTIMLALGGGVSGGRVLVRGDPAASGTGLATPDGHWPGLGPGELHVQAGSGEERDLKATTDFRDVFGEVLQAFLGLPADAVEDVLLGYVPKAPGLFV